MESLTRSRTLIAWRRAGDSPSTKMFEELRTLSLLRRRFSPLSSVAVWFLRLSGVRSIWERTLGIGLSSTIQLSSTIRFCRSLLGNDCGAIIVCDAFSFVVVCVAGVVFVLVNTAVFVLVGADW